MLRKMQIEDLSQILSLEQKLFISPWNEEQFLYEMTQNPYAHLFVIEDAGLIMGYIDYWITFEVAQLANIATAPSYQRKGVARQMMERMITDCEAALCENITLEVRIDNYAAQALYEHYGFIEVALRKQYYEDGCDAFLMIKPLGGNYV